MRGRPPRYVLEQAGKTLRLHDRSPRRDANVYHFPTVEAFEAEVEKLEQTARGYRRALDRFRGSNG